MRNTGKRQKWMVILQRGKGNITRCSYSRGAAEASSGWRAIWYWFFRLWLALSSPVFHAIIYHLLHCPLPTKKLSFCSCPFQILTRPSVVLICGAEHNRMLSTEANDIDESHNHDNSSHSRHKCGIRCKSCVVVARPRASSVRWVLIPVGVRIGSRSIAGGWWSRCRSIPASACTEIQCTPWRIRKNFVRLRYLLKLFNIASGSVRMQWLC